MQITGCLKATLGKEWCWMSLFMEEHRDDSLCADCGGKCCYAYGPPYNLNPKRLHEDTERSYGGGRRDEYGVAPLPEKIHPDACEYLGEQGCIIPWENRPPICKNYRCGMWRDMVYRR
jgi:Fe-S-cluster containining protein